MAGLFIKNANFGHGHVYPRPDGMKARCGGPGICPECSKEASYQFRKEKPTMNAAPVSIEERIENDFSFHPAAPGGQAAAAHDQVRLTLKNMALQLISLVPPGRDQSLMLTALEEAMHWANAGIAKQGPRQ